MKNWLTIGQFSQRIGVSAKALRLYEKMGLIQSHTRGENGYRYYEETQVALALRLKGFKDLGFSLNEIKSLLQTDPRLNFESLTTSLENRLIQVSKEVEHLRDQKKQIENILSSLKKKSEPLQAQQRRAIMSFYGQASIVITGRDGLEITARFTQEHFKNAGHSVPILNWNENFDVDQAKPYILIVKESQLGAANIDRIHPDIIVIKDLGSFASTTEELYLRLYDDVGPHVTTIMNADDRASVSLAGNPLIQKGRIFYFSKNRGFEPQIKSIGGVLSDGGTVDLYGFNLQKPIVHLKLKNIMPYSEEIALLSSFGAVMTVGLDESHLKVNHAE